MASRNLVICPSIDRVGPVCEMLSSFYSTQEVSDLIILTAVQPITDLINAVNFDGYDFVTITNDDFVFNTPGWDSKLISSMNGAPGFAYGFDGLNNHLPTTCMMSAIIPRTLGWIQLPGLKHLCGDLVWMDLGRKIDRLFFNRNVLITHNQKEDSVYAKTNSKERYRTDGAVYESWRKRQSDADVRRLREALGL